MPIAILAFHEEPSRAATAAGVVLQSFDSSEPLEERAVRIPPPVPGRSGRAFERELRLLRAVLARLETEIQVIVLDGYVWLEGTKRPGLGAHLYEALGQSVSVMGIAASPPEDGRPAATEVVRGRGSSPLLVTSVGFPPPVVGKLVRSMHGRGRIPWAVARAAALSRGRAAPRRFVRRAAPAARALHRLPGCARIHRGLGAGDHGYLELLPQVGASPALRRVCADPRLRERLVARAVVQIRGQRGFAFVDVERPCIVLSETYYERGAHLDLYLDLLHELTHLRQLTEGFDLWDERFEYVDRPTEVEGYAVAVEEGRRLGMTERDVFLHLSNPWMTEADVRRLIGHIDTYLGGGELPNLALARQATRRKVWRPW